jgi:hypothetical protein
MQDIPEPIATLDLGDTENLEKNYKNFVEKLIQTMVDDTDVKFKFTEFTNEAAKIERFVPVTPGLDYSPTGNFSFDLSIGDARLRVVCDKYQLWFRGIVTSDGRRYEIDDDEKPRVMAHSGSLHTDGMYPSLVGAVHKCKVGYQSLLRAVPELAKLGSKGDDLGTGYKSAIAVVLVMCFEAARFKEVFDFCLSLLKDKKDEEVGQKNRALINDWADICYAFYAANRYTKDIIITVNTSARIKGVYDGVQVLCRSKWDYWNENNNNEPTTRDSKRRGKLVRKG